MSKLKVLWAVLRIKEASVGVSVKRFRSVRGKRLPGQSATSGRSAMSPGRSAKSGRSDTSDTSGHCIMPEKSLPVRNKTFTRSVSYIGSVSYNIFIFSQL